MVIRMKHEFIYIDPREPSDAADQKSSNDGKCSVQDPRLMGQIPPECGHARYYAEDLDPKANSQHYQSSRKFVDPLRPERANDVERIGYGAKCHDEASTEHERKNKTRTFMLH